MEFDLNAARRSNVSDEQIVSFLKQKAPSFDIDAAMRSKVPLDQIVSFVNSKGLFNGVKVPKLLDAISKAEGTDEDTAAMKGYKTPYDITLGYGSFADDSQGVSNMSVRDVKALQSNMLSNDSNRFNTGNGMKPSSAVGRYQVTNTTLKRIQDKLGFSDDDKFDKNLQDKIGVELLNEAGYQDFLSGKITKTQLQKKVAGVWASVADPETGSSRYGQGTSLMDISQYVDDVVEASKPIQKKPVQKTAPKEITAASFDSALKAQRESVIEPNILTVAQKIGQKARESAGNVMSFISNEFNKGQETSDEDKKRNIEKQVNILWEASKFPTLIASKDVQQKIENGFKENAKKVTDKLFEFSKSLKKLDEAAGLTNETNPELAKLDESVKNFLARASKNIKEIKDDPTTEIAIKKLDEQGYKTPLGFINTITQNIPDLAVAAVTVRSPITAPIGIGYQFIQQSENYKTQARAYMESKGIPVDEDVLDDHALQYATNSSVTEYASNVLEIMPFMQQAKGALTFKTLAGFLGKEIAANTVSGGVEVAQNEQTATQMGKMLGEMKTDIKKVDEIVSSIKSENVDNFVAGFIGSAGIRSAGHIYSNVMNGKKTKEERVELARKITNQINNPDQANTVFNSIDEDIANRNDLEIEDISSENIAGQMDIRDLESERDASNSALSLMQSIDLTTMDPEQAKIVQENIAALSDDIKTTEEEIQIKTSELKGVEKDLVEKDVVDIVSPTEDAAIQTDLMKVHQKEMSDELGRDVTEIEAAQDWVAQKPEIQESLSELYREKYIKGTKAIETDVAQIPAEGTNVIPEPAIVEPTVSEVPSRAQEQIQELPVAEPQTTPEAKDLWDYKLSDSGNGEEIVGKVYHATESSEGFNFSDAKQGDNGFHVGTKDQAQQRFEENSFARKANGKIMEGSIHLKNAIRLDGEDTDYDWTAMSAIDLIEENHPEIDTAPLREIVDTQFEKFKESGDMKDYPQFQPVIDFLSNLGYDGIVYRNEAEGKRKNDSIVPFRPETIAQNLSKGEIKEERKVSPLHPSLKRGENREVSLSISEVSKQSQNNTQKKPITEISDAQLGRERLTLDFKKPEQKIRLQEIKSELARRRSELVKATQSTKEAEIKAKESVRESKAPLAVAERSNDVKKTSKKAFSTFVDKVSGDIKMVNERAELAAKETLTDKDKTRIEEITGKLPEHLKTRMVPINKKQNRGKFKNAKTPDQIRAWMADVMKADKDLVKEFDDSIVLELKDQLEPFMGLEGLDFTKKYVGEIKKGKQEDITGKEIKTEKKQKKIDFITSVINGEATFDENNKDIVSLVDSGIVQVIDGIVYDSYAPATKDTKSDDFGMTKLEVLHRNITVSSKETSGQKYEENKRGQDKDIQDFRSDLATDKTMKELSNGKFSSRIDRKVSGKGFISDIVRLFESDFVTKRSKDKYKSAADSIRSRIKGESEFTTAFVQTLIQGLYSMDISKMNLEQARRWEDTTKAIETYSETEYGGMAQYEDAYSDIEDAYKNGDINEEEYSILQSFSMQAGFTPGAKVTLPTKNIAGQLVGMTVGSAYSHVRNMITLGDVTHFHHESLHWASMNALSPEERQAFRHWWVGNFLDPKSPNFGKQGEFIKDKGVLNSHENPEEFFAQYGAEMIIDGKVNQFRDKILNEKAMAMAAKDSKMSVSKIFGIIKNAIVKLFKANDVITKTVLSMTATDAIVLDFINKSRFGATELAKKAYDLKFGIESIPDFTSEVAVIAGDDNADFNEFSNGEISKKVADTIRWAILARDAEAATVGESIDIQEAQALFISYGIQFLKKGDIRKRMFNTVKNIKRVGDASWNQALNVVSNAVEIRKRSEQIVAIQKTFNKISKRELSPEMKERFDLLVSDYSMKKMTNKTFIKLNDLVNMMIPEDGFMTPTELVRVKDAEYRLSKSPISDLSYSKLLRLNQDLSQLLREDIDNAEFVKKLGKEKIVYFKERALESASQFKSKGVLRNIELNSKNEKLRDLAIGARKAIEDSKIWDLNVEFTAEMMGESGSAITDLIVKPMFEGKEEAIKWKFESIDEFQRLIKESGLNIDNWSRSQYSGIDAAMNDKKVKRLEFDLDGGKTLSVTYDELANLLRVMRDPDGYRSLIASGLKRKQGRTTIDKYDITRDDVVRIIKGAPQEVAEFAFGIGDKWFNGYEKERLNKLGNEFLGHDIAVEGDTYTHIRKDSDDVMESNGEYGSVQEILSRNGHNSTTPASLKARKEGANGAIIIEGMTDSVIKSSIEHGVYAGFGKRLADIELATKAIAKELNEVGGESIADKVSKKVASEMSSAQATRYSSTEKAFDKVKNAYTVGMLRLKFGSAIIQNTAVMMYPGEVENDKVRGKIMTYIPEAFANASASLLKNKMDYRKAFKEMTDNSPMMRQRLEAGITMDISQESSEADVKRFLLALTGSSAQVTAMTKLISLDANLDMIRMADANAVYTGWLLAKKQTTLETGLQEGDEGFWDEVKDRHNNFVRKTQPTSDSFDNVGYQDTPMLKSLLMFSSARTKMWQSMRKGIWQMQHGKVLQGMSALALVIAMNALTDVLKEAWKAARGKKTATAEEFVIMDANTLVGTNVLFGDVLSGWITPAMNEALGTDIKNYGAQNSFLTDIKDLTINIGKGMQEDDSEKVAKNAVKMLGVLKIPVDALVQYGDAAQTISGQ